jgi:hypothetical protein
MTTLAHGLFHWLTQERIAQRQPVPILTLRCEWCKGLFEWHPRSPKEAVKIRRFCSSYCAVRYNALKQGY